jgi:RHS repeat-associated protein
VNNLFDKLATNDPLGRLLRLQEGHLSGSSITTLKRDERWQDTGGSSALSQTGNKLRHRLDLDGSGSFAMDDTRTYSKANELLTRDVNSNSTVDYILVYDAVGNLKDDNQHYKYTYDTQGRLTAVRNQSNALVAAYTYNAWGFRTTWHYDSVVNGTVNSDDPIFCFLYDERWRIAGTFRYDPGIAENGGKDEPAKEMFAYHAAGLAGMGGSSYIDAVILRAGYDPDEWTEPVDPEGVPTFTHIHYLLQNWRGDVSLVVTDAARVIEWVQYSAYGVPFGIPAGNASSNGANNVEDLSTLINWINNIVWDARWDLNADGSITTADYAYYPEKVLGRGVLSSVNNRIGYAAYQHAPELAGNKWHVRHRALDAERGEWLTRDPAGFIDGKNLYQYARSRPLVGVDPMGLRFVGATGDLNGSTSAAVRHHCGGSTTSQMLVAPAAVSSTCLSFTPGSGVPCSPCATMACCHSCCQSHNGPSECLIACRNRVCPACDPPHDPYEDCWRTQTRDDCMACCRRNMDRDVKRCGHIAECRRCSECEVLDPPPPHYPYPNPAEECKLQAHRWEFRCKHQAMFEWFPRCQQDCRDRFDDLPILFPGENREPNQQ